MGGKQIPESKNRWYPENIRPTRTEVVRFENLRFFDILVQPVVGYVPKSLRQLIATVDVVVTLC
jgi:hypothetical protein